MSALASRAEVIKLARELAADPDELEFLREASVADLRHFRQRVVGELDARHRPMFRKLAATSKLLPNAVTVKIAMKYFGPMLCGMVASELTAERAAALMNHIPVEFLADATHYVDPVASESIIRGLSTEKMVPTMRELLRRKEYVTLARFLGAVTDEQLLSVVPLVETGEDLLMTGFFAEVTDRFETVVRDLPEDRVKSIVRAAVDLDRFVEALTLMQHLTEGTRARVANTAADLGQDVLTAMVASAHREDAWAELIPVAASMDKENLRTTINLDVWDEESLSGLLRAAAEHDLWPSLRPMFEVLEPPVRERLLRVARGEDADVRGKLIAAARETGTPEALELADELEK